MAELWYPGADNTTQNFQTAFSRPVMSTWAILLLHSTETQDGTWPGYGGGASAPNLTVQGKGTGGMHRSHGHFPVNCAGRALVDPSTTGVQENRICVQIEIVATCDYRRRGQAGWTHVDDLPDSFWRWLGGFMKWLAPRNGMPLTSTVQWKAFQKQTASGAWIDDPNGAYGVNAPQRLSAAQFENYRGICGHQHASGNSHADPGPISAGVQRAIAYAQGTTTEVPVSDVHVSNDPPSETGYSPVEHLFVKADGTLWAEVADNVVITPPPVVTPPPVQPPPVDQPPPPSGDYPVPTTKTVYLSKLHYGQDDSDSVWHLQNVLNGHSLAGGSTIPTTGGYFDRTDHEVILCQQQHGFGNDAPGTSYVGPSQADHLFAGSGLTINNDTGSGGGGTPPPTQPPPPTGTIDTPFPGAVITTPYGKPGSWAAGFHTGQDYACPVGTPLRATWTGKVVAINAWGAAYGLHVIYEQTINGVTCRTAYCHMSRIEIAMGAATSPGTNFGKSGNTGNSTGPHLHVEQRTYPYGYNNKVQKPVM